MCGIATFTHDLCEAVAGAAREADCSVGAVNDRPQGYAYPQRVRLELQEKELDSYRRAADFLNFKNADVLCVQHEFGIYGGAAGSHLLTLLKEVRMPVVTTLHTILEHPDPAQRDVMLEVIRYSDRLVTMSRKGAEILRETYGVPESKVDVIAHGIPDLEFTDSSFYKEPFGVSGRQVLLTFGLIGPGKGIEYAIRALPEVVKAHPNVVYLILGATHPNLVAQEGERYRLGLTRLAEELGVKAHVIFYDRFVSLEDLKEFIGATDIYLTPYLQKAQVTSGTLAYVFGAGKAVVSTPYWHAEELLADGRGVLVPFRNAPAIAQAVCALLDDLPRMKAMQEAAYTLGRDMVWPVAAERYLQSFERARADRVGSPRAAFARWTLAHRPLKLPTGCLDHVLRMTDGTGIFQHAVFNVPSYVDGYCVDDNARAFLLCIQLEELGEAQPRGDMTRLATTYLAFLASALDEGTGRFRNFMSHARVWLEIKGSEDSHGRSLWATGAGAARSPNEGHRRLCTQLFEAALPVVESFSSPRAWAFALLGLHDYRRIQKTDTQAIELSGVLTSRLVELWKNCATDNWPWFEPRLTYDNARLSQALIINGQVEKNQEAVEIGLKSLRWLVSLQTTQAGCFRPIGCNGFYERGGGRADFDQQPIEALATISACREALRATRDPVWAVEAKRAFEWFLGRNDLSRPLYDFSTGGCGDGLHPDRVNANQGAESTLAFHLSLAEMNAAERIATATALADTARTPL